MLKPPLPDNESERLQALRALDILDTSNEERFDRLVRIAQHSLQVPVALISLVDAGRVWFKSHQGWDTGENPRDISFCSHAILEPDLFVVPDAAADSRFADNPQVLEAPHIRFYAGAPLTLNNGLCVGTLCVIDHLPRRLSAEQLAVLSDLAQCVVEELEGARAQQYLAELTLIQSKYAAIIESSDDAIMSKTLDGIITSCNPAAERLFGYSAQEAIGRPMAMLIPPERAGEEELILSRIGRGERIEHFETVRVRKDGCPVDVSVSISPIMDNRGKIIGASKIVRDISTRKQAEDALAKRMYELTERIKELRCLYQLAEQSRDPALPLEVFLARAVRLLPAACQHPETACARIVLEAQEYRSENYAAGPWQMQAPIVLNGFEQGFVEVAYLSSMPIADDCPFLHEERQLLDAFAGQIGQTIEMRRSEAIINRQLDELRKLSLVARATTNSVIITDAGGVTEWVNEGFTRLTGYTLAEIQGKKPGDVLHGPDSDPATVALMRERLGQGQGVKVEVINYHKNGTPLWLAIEVQPVTDEQHRLVNFIAIETDITERKRNEAELQESSQLVKSIVETVVDGIITIDSRGNVLSFNTAAERLFGFSQAEIIGTNVKCLMPRPYAAEHDDYLARYLKTREARVIGIGREVVGQRKDGSSFPMELAVSEMQQADRTLFVGIVRDITERKQVERMKSEFVSTVSHELRTPLTSIRGALGLVIGKFSSGLPDKARQLLETASRNSERLTLLINDILDLEKIESGRLEFEFKALDLTAIAQQAIIANESYGQQHEVRLRLVDTPESAIVWADAHRLLQVFANLISNAVKYSPAGGTVDVSVHKRDGRFRVSVRDAGRGIPAEFRNRIFQRFAQADSSDTREKGGTGLGLSITKAIVERHGGDINFTSEEGVSTEFFFELPEWQETIEQAQVEHNQPHMLICEDNPDVAMVLFELLKHEGVTSDRVGTAAAALEILKRKRYRGLLLDLGLPDMDGLTLIQQLRDDEATRDLPVIVVSGRTRGDKDAWDGRGLSVLDWLQKPVDRNRLGQALKQALQCYNRPRILHVEDDPDVVQVIQTLLEEDAYYTYASSLAAARDELAQNHYDLLLLDLSLPDGSGLELLDAVNPDTKVIVFSGQDPSSALKQHVTAALTKSTTSNNQLLDIIKRAINQERN